MEVASFICSICGDASRSICVFCTKDACPNHLCDRCHRCSDCCECDVPVINTVESVPHGNNGHYNVVENEHEEAAVSDLQVKPAEEVTPEGSGANDESSEDVIDQPGPHSFDV